MENSPGAGTPREPGHRAKGTHTLAPLPRFDRLPGFGVRFAVYNRKFDRGEKWLDRRRASERFNRIPAAARSARLPGPHGDQGRPAGVEAPPRQGAQAPDRFRREVTGLDRVGLRRPACQHVRRQSKRADFELIYKTGFKRSGRLMTMFTREREAGPARLGIAATRKMGAAVETKSRQAARSRAVSSQQTRRRARRRRRAAPRNAGRVRIDRIEAEFRSLLARSRVAPMQEQRQCLAASRSRLIRVYKVTLSPLFAGSCRYTPGCADYMSESIARFGCSAAAGSARSGCAAAIRSAATATIPSRILTKDHNHRWNVEFSSQSRCLSWCCFCSSAS